MDDAELARLLGALTPEARDVLRRAARADQSERDRLSERLLRERLDGAGHVAELVDLMSLRIEARQQLVRVLAELEARDV